jgi:hypothetical protein
MTDDQPTTGAAAGRPAAAQTPTVAPNLRRPGDDIPNRPRLKVRARTAPSEDIAAPAAALRRIQSKVEVTAPSGDAAEEVSADELAIREAKTIVVPPVVEGARNPFATYGPPPPDEKAEEAELAALTRRSPERLSTAFWLGVGLVVFVLVGGIWLARLGNKVASLESRLDFIEGHRIHTAALDLPGR